MFADEPDVSNLMFDPGPKHSTPIKERTNVSTRAREGSPELPVRSASEKPCYPEGSKMPASMPAVGKSSPWLHAAHISRSIAVEVGASEAASRLVATSKQSSDPAMLPTTTISMDANSLVTQQRKEIALLMGELQERDHELNELVRSHQHQLSVWEQDRQLILRLQHKCHRLTAELKQQKERNGLNMKQTRESSSSEDCKSPVQLIHQSPCSHHSSLQELQNHTENLNDSLKEVSIAKGQLQTKEQELVTLLKLKEKSLAEAEKKVGELRAQVKSLQLEKEGLHVDQQQVVNLWQQRCQGLQDDKEKLVGACQEKDRQLQKATTQLQDTLQQALVLQQALTISCEREKNKEELLTSAKARQERLVLELNQMRNLYKRQNREMTLLQLTLDTSKESDAEGSDCDRRVSYSVAKTNSSLNDSLSLPTASYIYHQSNTEQSSAPASTARHSRTAPSRADSEENMDSTSAYKTPHTMQRHVTEQPYNRGTRSSNRSSRTSATANAVSHRGINFEHQLDSNTNNNHSVADGDRNVSLECHKDPNTDNHSGDWRDCHSHGQSCSSGPCRSSSPHPSCGSPPICRDDKEDGLSRAQDVDTEAFWQKILSVRHGNQNDVRETKDLTQSPLKSWLTEVHAEAKAESHCQTEASAHRSLRSRDAGCQGQKPLNPELLGAGESYLHTAADTVRSGPDMKPVGHQNIPQFLPSCDFRTQHYLKHSPQMHIGLPGRQKERSPEDSSLDALSLSQPQVRQEQFKTTEMVSHSSHRCFQQNPQAEDEPQGSVGHGVSSQSAHSGATTPHNAETVFAPFDEKLSSFLESPEDNTSFDLAGSQGSSSPASKLHRLLLESQEMIMALEGRGQPVNM